MLGVVLVLRLYGTSACQARGGSRTNELRHLRQTESATERCSLEIAVSKFKKYKGW